MERLTKARRTKPDRSDEVKWTCVPEPASEPGQGPWFCLRRLWALQLTFPSVSRSNYWTPVCRANREAMNQYPL